MRPAFAMTAHPVTISLMKKLSFLVLMLAGPAFAQTVENAMLPDGSSDMYVGAALFWQRADNMGPVRGGIWPVLQMQWSNGVFLSGMDSLGMHLSSTPGVEYGPLLRWQFGRSPSDDPSLVGSQEIHASPNVGGFFNYYLGENLRLTSDLLYASDSGGMLLDLGIQKGLPGLRPHQGFSVSLGLTFASDAYAKQRFGYTHDDTTGASAPSYTPGGGLLNVHAGLAINRELSSKWLLVNTISALYLAPAAADSPLVTSRSSVSAWAGLARRF